jgi:phage terminase large subunit GpA-like protein
MLDTIALQTLSPQATELCHRAFGYLRPTERITLPDWADQHRNLSPEGSAVTAPTRWKTTKTEYQRGPMLAISDSRVSEVVLMWGAQLGKTEVQLNAIGLWITVSPAAILVALPTQHLAEIWSKTRLAPMIRDCERLAQLIPPAKRRDGENAVTHKAFPGGYIDLISASTPNETAGRPVGRIIIDEADRVPASAGTEGDPVYLLRPRQKTYKGRKKLIIVSTPIDKETSRVTREYEASDKRKYFVSCPHCGHKQLLLWKHVHYENDDPATGVYKCSHEACGRAWTDQQRHDAVKLGEWIAEKPFNGRAGFWLNSLYSPWVSIADAVSEWLRALDGGPLAMKAFVNTFLAEPWENVKALVKPEHLYDRREHFDAVPDWVGVLTCGIDVQEDRIEASVWGWGQGRRSVLVRHKVLDGKTNETKVFQDLTAFLGERYQRYNGTLIGIARAAIDTGGGNRQTTFVYDYVRSARAEVPLMAVKGRADHGVICSVSNTSRKTGSISANRGFPLYMVGTNMVKAELMACLDLDRGEGEPPPGYVHLPDTVSLKYCKQLVSETPTGKIVKGRWTLDWAPTHPEHEALDCRVYARAAAFELGIDYWTDAHWDEKIQTSWGGDRARSGDSWADLMLEFAKNANEAVG